MKKTDKIIALIVSVMILMCIISLPATASAPDIHSESYILSDINSDEILYQKGTYKEVLPSVSSKFMAIYTAMVSPT